MNRVYDGIHIGNSADARDVVQMVNSGIKTLVLCAFDLDIEEQKILDMKRNGIVYNHIKLIDGDGNEKIEYLKGVTAISEGLARGNVLVCCHEGRSRSGALVALFLHQTKNMDFHAAISSIVNWRKEIRIKDRLYSEIRRLFVPELGSTPIPVGIPVYNPDDENESDAGQATVVERKKRMLVISVSPQRAESGTGNLCNHLCRAFSKSYDVGVAGLACDDSPYEYATVYPKSEEWWNVIPQFNPDILFLSHDIWMFPMLDVVVAKEKARRENENRERMKRGLPLLPRMQVFGFFPIDAEPISVRWMKILDSCDMVAVPSFFGRRAIIERYTKRPVFVAREGVDPEFLLNMTKDKAKISIDESTKSLPGEDRDKFFVRDRFMVLFVGMNQEKKNLGALLDGFSDFSGNKNDVGIVVVAHSGEKNVFGEKIVSHIDVADMFPWRDRENGIFMVNGYVGEKKLANLYFMSDVLVLPSLGEGFGLPVLEAMAGRCIPMISSYSAHIEIPAFHFPLSATTVRSMWNAKRAVVSSESVSMTLELAYRLWKNDRKLWEHLCGQNQIRAKQLSWDKCTDFLLNLLGMMQNGAVFEYEVRRLS